MPRVGENYPKSLSRKKLEQSSGRRTLYRTQTASRRKSSAIASPPQSAPSADAAKSPTAGCRPGEKCWRYSRMPAYTQKAPMICVAPQVAP